MYKHNILTALYTSIVTMSTVLFCFCPATVPTMRQVCLVPQAPYVIHPDNSRSRLEHLDGSYKYSSITYNEFTMTFQQHISVLLECRKQGVWGFQHNKFGGKLSNLLHSGTIKKYKFIKLIFF